MHPKTGINTNVHVNIIRMLGIAYHAKNQLCLFWVLYCFRDFFHVILSHSCNALIYLIFNYSCIFNYLCMCTIVIFIFFCLFIHSCGHNVFVVHSCNFCTFWSGVIVVLLLFILITLLWVIVIINNIAVLVCEYDSLVFLQALASWCYSGYYFCWHW